MIKYKPLKGCTKYPDINKVLESGCSMIRIPTEFGPSFLCSEIAAQLQGETIIVVGQKALVNCFAFRNIRAIACHEFLRHTEEFDNIIIYNVKIKGFVKDKLKRRIGTMNEVKRVYAVNCFF